MPFDTKGATALRLRQADALASVLPKPRDRYAVTQEYLGSLYARTGDDAWRRQAAEMQGMKMDAVVEEASAEQRDLGDDMGL